MFDDQLKTLRTVIATLANHSQGDVVTKVAIGALADCVEGLALDLKDINEAIREVRGNLALRVRGEELESMLTRLDILELGSFKETWAEAHAEMQRIRINIINSTGSAA